MVSALRVVHRVASHKESWSTMRRGVASLHVGVHDGVIAKQDGETTPQRAMSNWGVATAPTWWGDPPEQRQPKPGIESGIRATNGQSDAMRRIPRSPPQVRSL